MTRPGILFKQQTYQGKCLHILRSITPQAAAKVTA